MVRVKRGFVARRKRKKIFARTKGYRKTYGRKTRQAKQSDVKAKKHATRHRKEKKRDMRSLWIARINAAVRTFDLSYSRFIAGLKKAKIDLDRRSLADLAANHAAEFAKIVEVVKGQ